MFQIITPEQERKLRNVTFLIVYALFAFWFLINGSGLFTNWTDIHTYTTLIYLSGVAIFLSIQEKLPKDLERPLSDIIVGFCIATPITLLILIGIRDSGLYFANLHQLPIHLIPITLVYQLVIVCASEEIIFRGAIFRFLYQYHWLVAWIGSAFIFAVFHFAVYQGGISAFIIAFFIGIILAWAVDGSIGLGRFKFRLNLGVSIAIHWSWNVFILGAIVTFV